MKWILLAACGCSLFLTAGCVSSHEEWRGHAINVLYVDPMAPPPLEDQGLTATAPAP
jgi:hypothetical protein